MENLTLRALNETSLNSDLIKYAGILLIFSIPGYIWFTLQSHITAKKYENADQYKFTIIIYGILNYLLWSFLNNFINLKEEMFWVVVLILGPLFLGICCGRILYAKAFQSALAWLGLKAFHPFDMAWKFMWLDRGKDPQLVLVTLKDNNEILGLWNENAFASIGPNPDGIYIGDVLFRNEYFDSWETNEKGNGIFIPYNEVKYINLFSKEVDND